MHIYIYITAGLFLLLLNLRTIITIVTTAELWKIQRFILFRSVREIHTNIINSRMIIVVDRVRVRFQLIRYESSCKSSANPNRVPAH